MKQSFFILLFWLFPFIGHSQELLADVAINYSKVEGSNTQVFKTLEKNIKDFINNTSWTGKPFALQERVKCAFIINIVEIVSTDKFKAEILIQSSRPVFNSTYLSPVLNFQDSDFTFNYSESENLLYNNRRFSGKNLTDVLSFYVFIILGYDADTFSPRGGNDYFNTAKKIADNSNNQGFNGWSSFDGPRTKGSLVAELINSKNTILRDITYQYHRRGMDIMMDNQADAKRNIANSLIRLNSYSNDFQYYPLDLFLQGKKEEIRNIFSGGDVVTNLNTTEIKSILQTISPKDSKEYWDKIKN